MANCYFCGCFIRNGDGYRRKVRTSESVKIYFTKRGSGSYGQTYALRTLCSSCARQLDRQNANLSWQLPISFIAGVAGTILSIRWAVADQSQISGLGSLVYAFFLFGGAGFITFFVLKIISSDISNALHGGGSSKNEISEYFQNPNNHYDEDDEIFDYKESILRVAMSLGDMGASLQGIYGLPNTVEGWISVTDAILDTVPPKKYSSRTEWERHIKNEIFSKFSSISSSDNTDAKLHAFPRLKNEDDESYEARIGRTAIILSKGI